MQPNLKPDQTEIPKRLLLTGRERRKSPEELAVKPQQAGPKELQKQDKIDLTAALSEENFKNQQIVARPEKMLKGMRLPGMQTEITFALQSDKKIVTGSLSAINLLIMPSLVPVGNIAVRAREERIKSTLAVAIEPSGKVLISVVSLK